jgi:hypothetical protein
MFTVYAIFTLRIFIRYAEAICNLDRVDLLPINCGSTSALSIVKLKRKHKIFGEELAISSWIQ